jgi:hypothetical protein
LLIRTPLLAAMHEDDSPELKEVAKILKETLEVDGSHFPPILVVLI